MTNIRDRGATTARVLAVGFLLAVVVGVIVVLVAGVFAFHFPGDGNVPAPTLTSTPSVDVTSP